MSSICSGWVGTHLERDSVPGASSGAWRGSGADHISLAIPQEGPLWKQGCIDLLNAIPAIFSLGYFLN